MSYNEENLKNYLTCNFKMANIDIIDRKFFKLVEPKKGHLIKNPIYSGYTKENISSIPRDIEKVMLNKEKDKFIKRLYNNKKGISKILNKRIIGKNNISKNQTYSKLISPFYNNNEENKSMIQNSKKIKTLYNKNDPKNGSKTERFIYQQYTEYISKFYPGPGEYISDKYLNILSNNNSFRYKSLFISPKKNNIKKIDNTLGPGSYDTSGDILFNKKHIGISLNQRTKRFTNNTKNINQLGPGQYFQNINNYITKNNNNNNNNNNRVKSLPLKNKINKLKKYIIVNDNKEYEVPGPGKYNLLTNYSVNNFSKKTYKYINNNKNKLKNKKNEKENLKEFLIKNENNNNNSIRNIKKISNNNSQHSSFNKNKSYDNKSKKIGITLPFISKSKRIGFLDSYLNKHIPGPCYYYIDD